MFLKSVKAAICCGLLILITGFALTGTPTPQQIVDEALSKSTAESLSTELEGCRQFMKELDGYNAAPENLGIRSVEYGFTYVPKFYDDTTETVPVFWWKRKMLRPQDETNVPLIYIHGGAGINSWRGFRLQTNLVKNYPGDYLAFDLRGEGCSKRMASNLDPLSYEQYRVRYIFKDLEYLRLNLLHYPRWRILGNSRGATITLHYLANYAKTNPGVVESVYLHGNVLRPAPLHPNLTRQRGIYASGQYYLELFSGDDQRLAKIKSVIGPDECWTGTDNLKICGPGATDLMSFYLTNKAAWAPNIHGSIEAMLTNGEPDLAKIRTELAKHAKVGYAQFIAFILGTNLRDTSSMPSPDQNEHGELTNDPSFEQSFLSENRLLLNLIYPFHEARGLKIPHSGVDPISYDDIIQGIRQGGTKLFYYHSKYDPIGNAEIAEDNRRRFSELGSQFSYIELDNSSHDGWYSEPRLTQDVLKP